MCEAYSKCDFCSTNRKVCAETQDVQGDCSAFVCVCPYEICHESLGCYSDEEYRELFYQRSKNVKEKNLYCDN